MLSPILRFQLVMAAWWELVVCMRMRMICSSYEKQRSTRCRSNMILNSVFPIARSLDATVGAPPVCLLAHFTFPGCSALNVRKRIFFYFSTVIECHNIIELHRECSKALWWSIKIVCNFKSIWEYVKALRLFKLGSCLSYLLQTLSNTTRNYSLALKKMNQEALMALFLHIPSSLQ
jgi:hypothetical protein